MSELKATLIALRMVIFVLGFLLGMAYTAWVFDHMGGLIISLVCAIVVAAAWFMVERDVKDQMQ